jgi:hypothetical protein
MNARFSQVKNEADEAEKVNLNRELASDARCSKIEGISNLCCIMKRFFV